MGAPMPTPPQPEDARWMAEALALAARLPRRPWPNPPVGALVVRDGRVVGSGAHQGTGWPHAEVLALDEAGEAARGATLYLTLEPCNHHGRTPPCAPRVAASGLARLVVAVADPNPTVPGGGLAVAQDAGLALTVGVAGERALDLIWPFVTTNAFERPYVLLKTAVSLDGRFTPGPAPADAEPRPAYLTGLAARRDAHILRRWADIVLVGERTVAADRPQLNGRLVPDEVDCPAAEPLPAYADSDLSFAGDWAQERFLVFAGERAAPQRRARVEAQGGVVVPCAEQDGRIVPESLLAEAFRFGGRFLLIEGGPRLAGAFLARGLVDRWVQYVAPVFSGGGVQWPEGETGAAERLHFTDARPCGRDLRLVHDRLPFAQLLQELTVDTAAGLRRRGDGA
ncbi:MAG: bifunctional diaminohydroxyphosphoribosylaminopyrimidine deaminase/5-amino-6-(5-phosphoribosylamino)uracil reductase RibD [Candidatus Krumholzibacteriia bacterium]